MADESGSDPRWLTEPPAAGEVHVYVKAGEGVELSEAARGALERLIEEIQQRDVEGFALGATSCADLWKNCYPFTCTLDNCKPLYSQPCLADTGCKIAEFGRRM